MYFSLIFLILCESTIYRVTCSERLLNKTYDDEIHTIEDVLNKVFGPPGASTEKGDITTNKFIFLNTSNIKSSITSTKPVSFVENDKQKIEDELIWIFGHPNTNSSGDLTLESNSHPEANLSSVKPPSSSVLNSLANSSFSKTTKFTSKKPRVILLNNPERPIPETEDFEGENPCLRQPLPKPNFKASGKRISEQKCDEIKWERDFKVQEVYNQEDCKLYERLLDGRESNNVYSVIGGRLSTPGENVHMGAIGWKAVDGNLLFMCGSTLISPRFVLTAAHCTYYEGSEVSDPLPKIVRLSDGFISDKYFGALESPSPTDYNISRIIIHPKYMSPKKYYDIALLEIEGPKPLLELNKTIDWAKKYRPACLWPHADTSSLGTKAEIAGWGVTNMGPGIDSRKRTPALQVATVNILDSYKCDELLISKRSRNWQGLQDTQICAGVLEGGIDTCQGDSGGPLQVKIGPILHMPNSDEWDLDGALHYVIGVTSFSYKCAKESWPALYTRVSAFIDWIESEVWPDEI